MSSVPGYAGMPVIGDKSVEFYKDAVQFVNKRQAQHDSTIFLTRILNKHTVFVTSNAGVWEILKGKFDSQYIIRTLILEVKVKLSKVNLFILACNYK